MAMNSATSVLHCRLIYFVLFCTFLFCSPLINSFLSIFLSSILYNQGAAISLQRTLDLNPTVTAARHTLRSITPEESAVGA